MQRNPMFVVVAAVMFALAMVGVSSFFTAPVGSTPINPGTALTAPAPRAYAPSYDDHGATAIVHGADVRLNLIVGPPNPNYRCAAGVVSSPKYPTYCPNLRLTVTFNPDGSVRSQEVVRVIDGITAQPTQVASLSVHPTGVGTYVGWSSTPGSDVIWFCGLADNQIISTRAGYSAFKTGSLKKLTIYGADAALPAASLLAITELYPM